MKLLLHTLLCIIFIESFSHAANISGHILDASNNPPPSTYLDLFPNNVPPDILETLSMEATSDSIGYYNFHNVNVGDYTLLVRNIASSNYLPIQISISNMNESITNAPLLPVTTPLHTLHSTIIKSEGISFPTSARILPDMRITATSPNSPILEKIYPNDKQIFVFSDLHEGVYQVRYDFSGGNQNGIWLTIKSNRNPIAITKSHLEVVPFSVALWLDNMTNQSLIHHFNAD